MRNESIAVLARAVVCVTFGCSSAGTTPPGTQQTDTCPLVQTTGAYATVGLLQTDTPACPEPFDPEPVRAKAQGEPLGWASVQDLGLAGTRGGLDGQVVLARTLEELVTHARSPDPLIIAVCGSVGTGIEEIEVEANKTVIGIGKRPTVRGGFDIDDTSNVVIRDLYIAGAHPIITGSNADGIAVRRSHHIWLDHLDIADSRDGNLDVSNESNYVTISHTRFWYHDPAREHRFSNLIGSDDDAVQDRGLLKVTLHHNWWADNVVERMPRARYGDIHVFNNYYTSRQNNYCIRAGVESRILAENNYFLGTKDPQLVEGGNVLAQGNHYEGSFGSHLQTGMAFEPPYTYELTPVCDIPLLVSSNAGPRPD
jgi:pectate lyase